MTELQQPLEKRQLKNLEIGENKKMKYRIDTLHKRGGKEVYMISLVLTDTLSRPAFPGKVFPTKEAAEKAIKEATKCYTNSMN